MLGGNAAFSTVGFGASSLDPSVASTAGTSVISFEPSYKRRVLHTYTKQVAAEHVEGAAGVLCFLFFEYQLVWPFLAASVPVMIERNSVTRRSQQRPEAVAVCCRYCMCGMMTTAKVM